MPSFMNSALFLLAVPALLQGAHGLRGAANNDKPTEFSLEPHRGRRSMQEVDDPIWGWELGKCKGTFCGGYGDPHLFTCDNLWYDCQAIGIVTVMENDLFNMQATFIDVGSEEKIIMEDVLTQGASITNDFMVQYKADPSAPVIQFGFGDIVDHDGTFPAEGGCNIGTYYHETYFWTNLKDVESCRIACEDDYWCEKFTYWYDSYCFFHQDSANLYETQEGWTRAVTGHMDSDCGLRTEEEEELMIKEENAKATRIGNGCPLLMFVDGEMEDISSTHFEGDIYGSEGDDIHVQLFNNNMLHITYKLDDDSFAVVELSQNGIGPGELWSCHFNFFICLPETHKTQVAGSTVGILGNIDGVASNDWMTKNGTSISYGVDSSMSLEEKDSAMMDYCYDNWCVEHDFSLMTYHGNHTYEDYKCEEQEYIPITNRTCVLAQDKIVEACKDMPPLFIHSCEVDCCVGGCGQITRVLEEIVQVKTLSEEGQESVFDIPNFDKCEGDTFEGTSDSVCGDGVEAVTLLKVEGTEELPEGEIFYDIDLHSEPSREVGHRTVKFKVNNPFPDTADVYIKYEKAVMDDMADSHCDPMLGTVSGCDTDAAKVEVLCRTFDGVDPFALVQVYFVSNAISAEDSPTIDKCCKPEPYGAEAGVVSYTFEVACGCPANIIA